MRATAKILWMIVMAMMAATMAQAQVHAYLERGNAAYDKHKYREAEKLYGQALQKDPDGYTAKFNNGDALFQENNYKEAAGYYERAGSLGKSKTEQEQSYYNLGNAYLKQDQISESIDAYKKALKINPGDLHAKYNLSYAIEKRKQQQKNQNQKDKDKKQQANNKPDNKPGQGKNNEQNQPQKPAISNQPQQDKTGISEQEAEQILNALNHNEQKIRQRMYDENKKPNRQKSDKPW